MKNTTEDMRIEREFEEGDLCGTLVFDIWYEVDGMEVISHYYDINVQYSTMIKGDEEIEGPEKERLIDYIYENTVVDVDFYGEVQDDWTEECVRGEEYRDDY